MKDSRKKAWKIFSRYIRLRECKESLHSTDSGKCFTCGKITGFAEMDAGHLIAGRRNSVLFEEKAVRGQCKYCNNSGGKPEEFRNRLIALVGLDQVEEIENNKNRVLKMTESDYQEIIKEYTEKYERLLF